MLKRLSFDLEMKAGVPKTVWVSRVLIDSTNTGFLAHVNLVLSFDFEWSAEQDSVDS